MSILKTITNYLYILWETIIVYTYVYCVCVCGNKYRYDLRKVPKSKLFSISHLA